MGAGTGATVGKLFGMRQAMKSGIGSASLTLGSGVVVAALVAVNALGDVIDPATGKIVAGARKSPQSREFRRFRRRDAARRLGGRCPVPQRNTTLAVVATNAGWTAFRPTNWRRWRVSAWPARFRRSIRCRMAILPSLFRSGNEQATVDEVGIAASEVLAMAVLRAVRAAKTAGGVPGLSG